MAKDKQNWCGVTCPKCKSSCNLDLLHPGVKHNCENCGNRWQ